MMQEWFEQAKIGIFIHWGAYSVYGISESWAFAMGQISYDDYMKQLGGFTAEKYDPKKWARLFRQAGAKYAVLTSKHHEGLALFDTKYTDFNVLKATPAGRDLLAPYCDALREEGLKVGVYFTCPDWADMDHMTVILNMTPEEILAKHHDKFDYTKRWVEIIKEYNDSKIEPTPEKAEAWARFMKRYKGEIEEIMTGYGDVDLMWFDMLMEMHGYSWDSVGVKKMINTMNPKTVVNSRLIPCGDYLTPECYVPLKPQNAKWELCSTFSENWGYRENDQTYKTVQQVVRLTCECISKGGNLLISVGPDKEGAIPAQAEKLMLEMGEWTSRYAEAIYPTKAGIGAEYFAGGSTLSADNKTLYLFVYDKPTGKIMLNGVRNKAKKITAMKTGAELSSKVYGGAPWLKMPGCIWIDVGEADVDDVCTVIKVEFEDEIDLLDANHQPRSLGGN